MTLLALDTSTEWASVALYDGRDVLAEETWHAQRRHADELFPTIERLLARTRITLASIDKVAVATGPGSFTGLRIAIAAAQGLARGAGAAMVGISPRDGWLLVWAALFGSFLGLTIRLVLERRRFERAAANGRPA